MAEQPLPMGPEMTDWSQIVEEHGPMVWRTAFRLLNNEADASDCFQRTFISALELEGREVVRNWPAFLKRAATARAMECLRQRYRDSRRLVAISDGSVLDRGGANPVEAAEASELAEQLREALADLDVQQAQVFCLACLEGLRYQEIAEQLGLTASHVGVLLHRTKQRLQERLRAYEPPLDVRREVQP